LQVAPEIPTSEGCPHPSPQKQQKSNKKQKEDEVKEHSAIDECE